MSESVARRAGIDLSRFPAHEIQVRGRDRMLTVYAVADARDLPEPPARPAAGRARPGAAA